MLLIILHIVYVVGAVCCVFLPLDQSRVRAPWARWIFWVVAILLVTLGLDGFAEDLHLWPYHILPGIRGFVLGLLFVLIVSGQFGGRKIT